MDQETQRSQLKKLIIQGKEQGFLTYREINDHLPEDVHDTDQIEAVVNMINDMGIAVFDEPPDPDTLLLKTTETPPPAEDEEEAAEEAEQVVTSAVDSEFGRTTDPVRMYMREMGTVELLTREGEIDLAKRIEDGVRQTTEAIAACPAAIAEVVRMMDLVEIDQMRLTDLVVDFVDPDASDVPLPEGQSEKAAAADMDDDEEDESGGDGSDDEETGPNREEALIRFARIRKLHTNLLKAVDKKGYDSPEVKRIQAKLADEFMLIKFVSKQVNRLVEYVRSLVDHARLQEKTIMDICQPASRDIDRQEIHQPRPAVPRPDPGRQHRADEGGRQVRIPPRLQVLDLRHLVDPPGDHALDRRPGAHHPHPGAHDRDHQQAESHFAPDAAGNGARGYPGRAGEPHGHARGQDPQGAQNRQGADLHGDAHRR
jgi:RNA polymerase primary sigma factor